MLFIESFINISICFAVIIRLSATMTEQHDAGTKEI
jgi:hypothetical protein